MKRLLLAGLLSLGALAAQAEGPAPKPAPKATVAPPPQASNRNLPDVGKAKLPPKPSCAAAQTACIGADLKWACYNLTNDPLNCGSCGNRCPGEKAVCNSGHCDYAD